MKLSILALIFALAVAVPAFSDDQEKATKELTKVNAMATDATGRIVVNQSIAQILNVKRSDLVMERRDMNQNYGGIFIAHKLVASGAKMEDIAAQLKSGKDIFQIATTQHVNWKQLGDDAKQLNAKIDENLYKRLVDRKAGSAQDEADNYAAVLDGVTADNTVAQKDIDLAGDRYVALKVRAEDAAKRANRLDTASEKAAAMDHARSGGPTQGASGGTAPSAGGIR